MLWKFKWTWEIFHILLKSDQLLSRINKDWQECNPDSMNFVMHKIVAQELIEWGWLHSLNNVVIAIPALQQLMLHFADKPWQSEKNIYLRSLVHQSAFMFLVVHLTITFEGWPLSTSFNVQIKCSCWCLEGTVTIDK